LLSIAQFPGVGGMRHTIQSLLSFILGRRAAKSRRVPITG